MSSPDYPRLSAGLVRETLDDSPVVLIHGPRQCGKTTLAREVGQGSGHVYFSFDDPVVLAAAQSDPRGFVDDLPAHAILDEIQRAPALLSAIKLNVDRDRRPGRLILTGSSNVLLVPALADSLAGRLAIVPLHPLAQVELARRDASGFVDALWRASFPVRRTERLGVELIERVVRGGYPPAVARATPRRRASWCRDYVEALVQRDVADLARVGALDALPRLLTACADRTAQLLNVAELAAPFSLSRPTIADYVTLLERVFLVARLPPWHANQLSRLIKTPKLHVVDTGVACALLGLDVAALRADRGRLGHLVETFAVQELRRQVDARGDGSAVFHYRDKDGAEVDLVLEQGRRLAGVEVKAGATVTAADFRGLRRLAAAGGARFACGVVLYDGDLTVRFGEGLFAVPIRTLWER